MFESVVQGRGKKRGREDLISDNTIWKKEEEEKQFRSAGGRSGRLRDLGSKDETASVWTETQAGPFDDEPKHGNEQHRRRRWLYGNQTKGDGAHGDGCLEIDVSFSSGNSLKQ